MSAERSNARRGAEGGRERSNAWKVVGMSAERSSARRRAEGGRDECRKVKRTETRGRW